MLADSLPIVCKYCREPLRWRASGYIEVATGERHFIGDFCPVTKGADMAVSDNVAQEGKTMKA